MVKVNREFILSNSPFKKLALKAGIQRLSKDSVEYLQRLSRNFAKLVARKTFIIARDYKKKRVDGAAMRLVLDSINLKLIGDAPSKLEKCPKLTGKRIATKIKQIGAKSDCVEHAPSQFKNLLKSAIQSYGQDMGFSTDAINIAQLVYEDLMVRLLSNCAVVLVAFGKSKLNPAIIDSVRKVMEHPSLEYLVAGEKEYPMRNLRKSVLAKNIR